jgi:type II secretory ATPase GspE/PulE/Tfp pilus assembly ATPase PilB-like protein
MIKPEDVVLLKKSGRQVMKSTEKNRMALVIRRMISEAIEVRASDIHLEPENRRVRMRVRVDGFLRDLGDWDPETGHRLIGAVKVLCDMDITRKHRMQDGAFSALVRNRPVEFRVSVVEEVFGEKVVIRILDTEPEIIDLKKLGIPVMIETELRLFLTRPQGMLLMSGPTGSGKSTTLYSLLREVDRRQRNVIAIEDPIEYHLEYVTQIAVNPKAGVTYASALRTALRQDLNILMVGEIRDSETAAIAIQSGLTGHLVFSTVHARDSVATVWRLVDLGVEPFLVANVLNVAMAQRLVRCLCRHCKRVMEPDEVRVRPLGKLAKGRVYGPVGCERCEGTGYRGRTGIFEIIRMSEKLREHVLRRTGEDEIRRSAIEEGFVPILTSAMEKVNDGITSLDEIERVIG